MVLGNRGKVEMPPETMVSGLHCQMLTESPMKEGKKGKIQKKGGGT